MAMDLDAFIERAAIKEFCGGMSRFQAETEAAAAQGFKRHEVMNEIGRRDFEGRRDHRSAVEQHDADNLPRVQPASAQQVGPVPERDVQAGRDRGLLPSLRMEVRDQL